MKSVSRTKDGAGGVTSAQALPMRNSSHCIAAGTLAAVFCRRLKRSIVNSPGPVGGERQPLVGADAEPKVAGAGLIHKATELGDGLKSYLPTRKTVSLAWYSVVSKVAVTPVPPF